MVLGMGREMVRVCPGSKMGAVGPAKRGQGHGWVVAGNIHWLALPNVVCLRIPVLIKVVGTLS